jgi:hypothetical protein
MDVANGGFVAFEAASKTPLQQVKRQGSKVEPA